MHSVPQLAVVSKFRISPFSHSVVTSNGRQQTSQSVVKRWRGMLVSTDISLSCPQKGHGTFSKTSMLAVEGQSEKKSKIRAGNFQGIIIAKRGHNEAAFCRKMQGKVW
jgi:hypothetical protein